MLNKSFSTLCALTLLALSAPADARIRWAERDNRAVFLHPRRFGQEHPAVIDKLSAACPGQVCGNLAGGAITPLLAAQGECTQQDFADSIIDAAQQFDDATKQNMIALAVEYRQAEKNTSPDFTTNPPTNRNSVFCQKAPKNSQLNGLVQAQDPANDDIHFFDPATGKTVLKGDQANTFPFGTDGTSSSNSTASASAATSTSTSAAAAATTAVAINAADPCPTAVTVTVTAGSAATAVAATTTAAAAASTSAASTASGNIGDFGSCSVPQIEFGVGFDNRKETSFQPVDKTSFNHGSAQNIDIITQFICDTLTNSCGADATAKATCASAKTAADTKTAKTGAQADAFNAVFGITTNFAADAVISDTGSTIQAGAAPTAGASSAAAVATNVAATTTAAAASSTGASSSSSAIGDFGSCSVPQIEFGAGFDNRKETSFQPVDKTSYNHGSAQGIDIITKFICDTLTNSCGADATAKATCATASTAADGQTAKTGAQADAFNAAFGITTNFASLAVISDQGSTIQAGAAATASASVATSAAAAVTTTAAAAAETTAAAATTTSAAAAAATSAAASSSAASGGNLQTFTGSLGGVTAPAVTNTGSGAQPFAVDGNATFSSLQNALVRSCDVQHNKCANAANASGNQGDLTVSACGDQQTQCNAQAQSTAASA